MATLSTLNESNGRFAEYRHSMVEGQIRRRGIRDERVLRAMESVPRHEFVSAGWVQRAYADEPIPIGYGQTISQPYIVAVMSAALGLTGAEKVLEIGTGCGYQTAILAQLAGEVYSVEFLPELSKAAAERLAQMGIANVQLRCADGSLGWPEHAPYHAILVAAAAPEIPGPLLEQLAEGGRLVAPVGSDLEQELVVLTKHEGKYSAEGKGPCRFVPLVGRHGSGR